MSWQRELDEIELRKQKAKDHGGAERVQKHRAAGAYRAQIEAASDPGAERAEIEARLDALASPIRTAEAFGVEEIIDPRETRRHLCRFANLAAPLRAATPGGSRYRP